MTHRRKTKAVLSVAAIGLLAMGGLCGCSRKLSAENKGPEQVKEAKEKWPDQSSETMEKYANRLAPPKYQLIADGDQLHLDYDRNAFEVVKGSANPIRIESDLKSKMTVVKDGKREVARKDIGDLMASVWSDKYQRLCFVTCFLRDDVSDGSGKNDRTYLWSWDRKNGLKLLLNWQGEMIAQDGSPREMRGSVDGEYLAFQFRKFTKQEDNEKSDVVVYSLGQSKAFRFPVDEKHLGHLNMDNCSILDSHTLLQSGDHPTVVDLRTGQSRPITIPGGMFPITNFHGQMWALHFMNGKYDIIRVNSTLDKIEQTIEIPAKFPKPLRPPDYEDGGD